MMHAPVFVIILFIMFFASVSSHPNATWTKRRPIIFADESKRSMQYLEPNNLVSFYNVNGNGAGKTIAILDQGSGQNAEADLAQYSTTYSLPSCTTANGCFKRVDHTGGTNYPAFDAGWDEEIALDVQMVHAVAPNAKILLIMMPDGNPQPGDVVDAINYAWQNADYVSMSFGIQELGSSGGNDWFFSNLEPAIRNGIRKGTSFFAASGDSMNINSGWPSTSPSVVSVGGTFAVPNPANPTSLLQETGWPLSGCGCSQYYQSSAAQAANPSFAAHNPCTGGARSFPDIAANAGYPIRIYSTSAGGWINVGGTSAACPIMAGRAATIGQQITVDRIYSDTSFSFRDITSGSDASGGPGYSCQPGWDALTGLGVWINTPNPPPPTVPPTVPPTQPPTVPPTVPPTDPPTVPPTVPPTDPPTVPPTDPPTVPPTDPPTVPPTVPPTDPPTVPPTQAPTVPATNAPTQAPTAVPPTQAPTSMPPTQSPTGGSPTQRPTGGSPTQRPTGGSPTQRPTGGANSPSPSAGANTPSPSAGANTPSPSGSPGRPTVPPPTTSAPTQFPVNATTRGGSGNSSANGTATTTGSASTTGTPVCLDGYVSASVSFTFNGSCAMFTGAARSGFVSVLQGMNYTVNITGCSNVTAQSTTSSSSTISSTTTTTGGNHTVNSTATTGGNKSVNSTTAPTPVPAPVVLQFNVEAVITPGSRIGVLPVSILTTLTNLTSSFKQSALLNEVSVSMPSYTWNPCLGRAQGVLTSGAESSFVVRGLVMMIALALLASI